ncbi:MAG: hydroxylamine reductase, partial [Deltaproteobacteria bacterium]|nr:hydroxylamine reductase [Deltaproteobacteria bacterium]
MSMFCFQCQQTAKGTGCTVSGVCGKKPDTSHEQDVLTCELIGLATAMQANNASCSCAVDLLVDGLFTCITNVNFDTATVAALVSGVKAKREKLGGKEIMQPGDLFGGDENIRSLRSTLLFGLRGMAAYAHHARALGKRSAEVDAWFIKGLAELGKDHS